MTVFHLHHFFFFLLPCGLLISWLFSFSLKFIIILFQLLNTCIFLLTSASCNYLHIQFLSTTEFLLSLSHTTPWKKINKRLYKLIRTRSPSKCHGQDHPQNAMYYIIATNFYLVLTRHSCDKGFKCINFT